MLPQLQPFDGINPHSVVILDNCSIHHVASIHELFEASVVLLLFLPLDLMPIEEAFSSVKSYLKGHDDCLQATDDPLPIIRAAFESISLSSVKPGSLMPDIPTNHKHMITHVHV